MMAPDLTRDDAVIAIAAARRALGGLGHLAIAGVLHSVTDADLRPAMLLVTTGEAAAKDLVEQLGEFALQLPEARELDGGT